AADPRRRARWRPESDCAGGDRRSGGRGRQTRSVLEAVCIRQPARSGAPADLQRAERNAPMRMKTRSCVIAGAATILLAASIGAQSQAVQYEADVAWPKPLPNRWVLGGLGGVCVDAQDHVLILNRQDVVEGDLNGATLAPSIIEFDPAGNVVNSWGDPKLLDPRLHSCHFDKEGNVWIAAAPSGMIQKYTHDGSRLLLQIGKKGELDSSDGTDKGKPPN